MAAPVDFKDLKVSDIPFFTVGAKQTNLASPLQLKMEFSERASSYVWPARCSRRSHRFALPRRTRALLARTVIGSTPMRQARGAAAPVRAHSVHEPLRQWRRAPAFRSGRQHRSHPLQRHRASARGQRAVCVPTSLPANRRQTRRISGDLSVRGRHNVRRKDTSGGEDQAPHASTGTIAVPAPACAHRVDNRAEILGLSPRTSPAGTAC